MATISNYKEHLKLSEGIKIERYLNEGKSFRFISKEINKGVNTISREIENRRYKEKRNYFNGFPGKCKKIEKAPLFVILAQILKSVALINFIIVLSLLKRNIEKF